MSGIRYLALGDSYTIGEGVPAAERWPSRLAEDLRALGMPMDAPTVIARTGWTCDELEAGIETAAPRGPFPLVSLLIGVNDEYRGGTPEAYGPAFQRLLRRAATLAGERTGRVVVLSIPDWGVSPFALGRDRAEIAARIDAFNTVNRTLTRAAGARYVDITPSSRARTAQADFTADGLHPAGSLYTEWARLALAAATAALRV